MPKANRKSTTSPDEAAPPKLVSRAAEAGQTPEQRLREALNRVRCAADVLRLMAVANITCGEVIDGSSVELIGGLISNSGEEIEEAFAPIERSARRAAARAASASGEAREQKRTDLPLPPGAGMR
jgi:hypothetical protein